ncbi:uncharacterized protein LY89DRAFT_671529 [Mollisia scopiformis]|uniref:Uncharacterized protein n=1 Tax=Mollisia scopiformis TaxID=149040 RepID=A0A194X1T3_MOLSC|nr:uncharacterized protein LY89DRAFT_671529 [Mollisia scopiformis]KUJ14156.1 hypothetical protein LY89DRAFT_671529 [Mollisia scopiformis]
MKLPFLSLLRLAARLAVAQEYCHVPEMERSNNRFSTNAGGSDVASPIGTPQGQCVGCYFLGTMNATLTKVKQAFLDSTWTSTIDPLGSLRTDSKPSTVLNLNLDLAINVAGSYIVPLLNSSAIVWGAISQDVHSKVFASLQLFVTANSQSETTSVYNLKCPEGVYVAFNEFDVGSLTSSLHVKDRSPACANLTFYRHLCTLQALPGRSFWGPGTTTITLQFRLYYIDSLTSQGKNATLSTTAITNVVVCRQVPKGASSCEAKVDQVHYDVSSYLLFDNGWNASTSYTSDNVCGEGILNNLSYVFRLLFTAISS